MNGALDAQESDRKYIDLGILGRPRTEADLVDAEQLLISSSGTTMRSLKDSKKRLQWIYGFRELGDILLAEPMCANGEAIEDQFAKIVADLPRKEVLERLYFKTSNGKYYPNFVMPEGMRGVLERYVDLEISVVLATKIAFLGGQIIGFAPGSSGYELVSPDRWRRIWPDSLSRFESEFAEELVDHRFILSRDLPDGFELSKKAGDVPASAKLDKLHRKPSGRRSEFQNVTDDLVLKAIDLVDAGQSVRAAALSVVEEFYQAMPADMRGAPFRKLGENVRKQTGSALYNRKTRT